MKVNKKAIIFVLFFFCIAIAMPIVLGNNKENENIKNINEYMANDTTSEQGARSSVGLTVANKPIVDIMLTSKETNLDLSSFEADVRAKLESLGINTTNVEFQTVDRAMISTNASDASTIFNDWGRIGVAGNWALTTYGGKSVIWNKLNTNGATGFYSKENYNIKDATIEFKMRTTDSDDDYVGVFLRFNMNSPESTAQASKKATTYMYIEQMNNVSDFKAPNGLYKIQNNVLIPSDSQGNNITSLYGQPVAKVTSGWPTKNAWVSYKFVVEGNNIKAYRNGTLILNYTDTTSTAINKGSFGLVNWSQPAMFADFTVSYTVFKEFQNVLREPTWRENAHHVVVNVDDEVDETLTGTDTIGEILTRTLNDNIHFVQWGSTTNESATKDFINKNDEKGVFVSSANYSNCVEQTAIYIKNLIEQQDNTEYVIVGEDNDLVVEPASLKHDAVSEDFPNGRWMIHHNYTYFDNNLGQSVSTEVYTPDLMCNFDKPGEYNVYFDDDLVGTIYAHRRPVADFSVNLSGSAVTLASSSFDLDNNTDIGFGKGIKEEKWYYKAASASDWTEGKLTSYTASEPYVIKLEVTDYQGVTSYTTKYIGDGAPVASFNYGSNRITKYQKLVVNDTSYDPAGLEITGWEWTLKKGAAKIGTYTGSNVPTVLDFNTSTLGTGDYTYSLVVTNRNGIKSEAYTKSFTVIDDTDAPEVVIDPTSCDWKKSQLVNLTFSDGDSGFARWRYAIDDTQVVNDQTLWSDYLTDASYTLNITEQGLKYLHVQAYDNAGNLLDRTVGIYKIDNEKPNGTATIVQPTEEVRAAVIKFSATDNLSGVARIIKPDGTETSTSTIDYEVREPGTYTFKIVDYAGNENTVDIDVTIVSDGVVVKYVDKNTGANIETESLEGNVGQDYTTQAKQFEGYKLVSLPTNGSGKFEIDEQVVVYGYKKISAGVDVKYIDEITGEEIVTPTMHIDGLERDPYSTTSKEIEGYELVTTPENANGQMTVGLTTVTYGYKKNSNVISRYIDENSDEEIIPDVVVKYKEGYPYSTTERTFNGYRLVSKTDNTYGTVGREDIIVTYYYKKISAGVDVKYVDEMTGEEISGMIHMSGLENEEYTTTSKEIPGYELVTVPENANGQMTVGLTTVTYGYKLISYVTVRCVDENTNRILYISEPVKYLEGETYRTFKRDINEYTFSRVDKAEEAQVGREDITVTYYYKKNTSITVKYVDILDNNKEIHEALPIPGVQGDSYQISPVEVEGFRYVGSLGATQGVMGSEPTTIIYKYKKLANLVTEHIDANTGEKVAEDVTTTYKQGDTYEALPKNVKGYVVVEEPEEKTGIMGRDEIRKQYYYKKISGGLVVKYVDKITNQVLDRVVYDGNESDVITLEEKSFMHYVLDSRPDKTQVTLTPEAEELVFYYVKSIQMDVVGVDEATGEELYSTKDSGIEGMPYLKIAKRIEGYELVGEDSQEGTYSRDKTRLEFIYRKIGEGIESSVILRYMDKDTNQVLKSEVIKAKVGDKYTTQKLEFPNYKFVEVVGNESGTVTKETQEVTYYYVKEKGNVVVVYEDENGTELKREEYTGKIDTNYNVDITPVNGYEVVETIGNTSGIYINGTIEIKVKLQKIPEPVKTSNVVVVYEDEKGVIIKTEEYTGNVGEDYNVEIKEIDGYEIVERPENTQGKYTEETIELRVKLQKIPEPIKTGKVVVIYEDENGNEIKRAETEGNVGEDYKVEIEEINGYKLIGKPEGLEGKYIYGTIEIRIQLQKIPEPIIMGKVLVIYEDENGNEIKRDQVSGKVGTDYNVNITDVPGYTIVERPESTEGKYTEETIELKVKLEKIPEKIGKVLVVYEDENGKRVKWDEISGKVGTEYNVSITDVPGYTIVERPENTQGKYVDGTIELKVKLEKIPEPVKTGKVVVIYEDENGDEIRREASIGVVGEDYRAEIKEIDGYTIVEIPDNLEGKYTEETIELKVKLEKIPEDLKTGKVVVVYEDEDGNVVKRDENMGRVGEDYKVEIEEIDGYKVVQVPTNTEGKYTEETIELKIKLERIPEPVKTGKVVVIYEDENGNIVKTDEMTGNVGENYSANITDVPGYTIVERPTNTQGKYTEETIELKVKLEKIPEPVKTGKVVVVYEDENGNVVKREETIGKVGEDYKVEVKEIDGYEIVEVPANMKGKYTENTIEIKIKLQKIIVKPESKGTIVIKHIDEDGNVIAKDITKTGKVGEIIDIKLKEIKGYKLLGNETISVKFIDGEFVIEAKYQKIQNIDNPKDDNNQESIPDTSDMNVTVVAIIAMISLIGITKFIRKED